MKMVTLKEIVEIFLKNTIYDIKFEKEIPNINFLFNEDIKLLKSMLNSQSHDYQRDIDFLVKHSNDDCLNIEVKNSLQFFKYLRDIINETIKLFNYYNEYVDEEIVRYLLRRIWLRMGIDDVSNINNFLDNQLQFVKNRTLDSPNLIKKYYMKKYDVFMKTKIGELWDETTRRMVFTIHKGEDTYELPHILYDINDEGVCYIYGIQSSQVEKSKHLERNLYQLNKGIANPNVHPSKVYAMLLFINELKSQGIKTIIVPSMQVLSYHYHELLSQEAKKNYEEIKRKYEDTPDDSYIKNRCEYLKKWYYHIYQKEDLISYLKTEELIYLMYRITEHDTDIQIMNEVTWQGDSLLIKLYTTQKIYNSSEFIKKITLSD